jgi:hypothetical protein
VLVVQSPHLAVLEDPIPVGEGSMELDEIGDERLEVALGETLAAVERGEVPGVAQVL